jgi:protocatechuate 3,4-dioxygenase beta subunit
VLNLEGVAGRAGTLTAVREDAGGEDAGGVSVYRFDIRLQGDGETVFFNP